MLHAQTKHIKFQHHFMGEKIQDGETELVYIPIME